MSFRTKPWRLAAIRTAFGMAMLATTAASALPNSSETSHAPVSVNEAGVASNVSSQSAPSQIPTSEEATPSTSPEATLPAPGSPQAEPDAGKTKAVEPTAPPSAASKPKNGQSSSPPSTADTKPARPAAHVLSRQSVMRLQRALRHHGYRIGVDGILGPHTRATLKRYQRRVGLPVTGRADRRTLRRLGVHR